MSERYETDTELERRAPYDHSRWDDSDEGARRPGGDHPDDIDASSENVLSDWAGGERRAAPDVDPPEEPASEPFRYPESDPEPDVAVVTGAEAIAEPEPEAEEEQLAASPDEDIREPEPEPVAVVTSPALEAEAAAAEPEAPAAEPPAQLAEEHAPGALVVPPQYAVLAGAPDGARRAVGVVVSRFNGDITTRLLESALGALDEAGVSTESITVMPVPGAFELPLAAMALAKTRRFACVVALGCIIRGDTAHFDYVASEAASGIQLAGLETGVPVAFGVLTLESAEQAEERVEKGAEAVRTALEMADLFANLRAAAAQ